MSQAKLLCYIYSLQYLQFDICVLLMCSSDETFVFCKLKEIQPEMDTTMDSNIYCSIQIIVGVTEPFY